LLKVDKHRLKFLEYCPDKITKDKVNAEWSSNKDLTGKEMWEIWCKHYD